MRLLRESGELILHFKEYIRPLFLEILRSYNQVRLGDFLQELRVVVWLCNFLRLYLSEHRRSTEYRHTPSLDAVYNNV